MTAVAKLCFMITTTNSREESLKWNVNHLIKYINIPFSLYIYNDGAPPLKGMVSFLIEQSDRDDIHFEILNDDREISKEKVGCGGGRFYLFERVKWIHDIVVSLDDDMQITKGWYEKIVEAMNVYPNHSFFSCAVKGPDNVVQRAGSGMQIKDGVLYRIELAASAEKYQVAEWGPFGCLILCRKALQPEVKVPDLYVREDDAFYLEVKKLEINETVVVNDAVAIHRPIPTFESNLRIPEKMKEAEEFFIKKYGLKLH
jgi:hypothetical protein